MNLVIVESPSKAKTIEKYLGKEYKVLSTVGHIIDLPGNKLSVDLEKEYEPQFSTIKGKGVIVKKLKAALPKDGDVYLAMDPDREGEAIAWHTAQALKLKDPKRIVFHEITKNAVNEAIKHPRKIDQNLVTAQIARRVLDRLVGYKVSEVLWKKIWYGLSAGRVQSVALKLIVEREKEIEAFVPKEYWKIVADLLGEDKTNVKAELSRIDNKKMQPKSAAESNELEKDINGSKFEVTEVKKRTVSKHAVPPFTTSTLQQAANNVLGFTAKRTMGLAQVLYQAGHISYMRTDSLNMSDDAIKMIREHISSNFGEKYLPAQPNYYKTKSRNAQEAHEAIRPTDTSKTPEMISKEMGPAEAKLYGLIYNRAISSQMSNRESEIMSVAIETTGKSGKKYQFNLGAEKVIFDGFRKLWSFAQTAENENLQLIENIKEGDKFDLKELIKEQNFTKPKARYTDATLVKALELHGVGRPSTYATIISTVQDRGYVEKVQKYLRPLDVGRVVYEFLQKNFERLVNYEYTAGVEEKLDDITTGAVEYVPFMDAEYKPLVGEMAKADKEVEKDDVVILGKSDEKCPKCGSAMVIRLGRYGKFLSCTRFPECKGMKSIDGGEDKLDYEKYLHAEPCPKCGKKMLLKTGKYGSFWACEDYPDCKGVASLLLIEKCPESGHPLVERKGRWGKTFIGCSGYPDCKYIKKEPKKPKE